MDRPSLLCLYASGRPLAKVALARLKQRERGSGDASSKAGARRSAWRDDPVA
jgi:hypothetical protein